VLPVAGTNQLYLDTNFNGALDAGEPMIQLPNNVNVAGGGAPGGLNAALGFAPLAPPVRFNGRGVPCVPVAGVCSNWAGPGGAPVGFLYYLNQNVAGNINWAAVVVTPAGQAKTWIYSNNVWSNK
jgi:hypothetical protein